MDDTEALRERIAELETQLAEASIDEVTGIPTRRRLQRELETAWAAYDRNPLEHLSVLMIDVDHFKSVNDDFGHELGDRMLRKIADVIREHARSHDVFGRYGGEEFVMAVRTDTTRGAYFMAQRIRESVQSISAGASRVVTVSIGVYCAGDCPSLETALKTADSAMYQAKREGRNRVVIAQGPC